MSHLAEFYESTSPVTDKTFLKLVDVEGLKNNYAIFKEFVFLKLVEYEAQATTHLAIAAGFDIWGMQSHAHASAHA